MGPFFVMKMSVPAHSNSSRTHNVKKMYNEGTDKKLTFIFFLVIFFIISNDLFLFSELFRYFLYNTI